MCWSLYSPMLKMQSANIRLLINCLVIFVISPKNTDINRNSWAILSTHFILAAVGTRASFFMLLWFIIISQAFLLDHVWVAAKAVHNEQESFVSSCYWNWLCILCSWWVEPCILLPCKYCPWLSCSISPFHLKLNTAIQNNLVFVSLFSISSFCTQCVVVIED